MAAARRIGAADNDPSSLDPDFRARLDRVVARMTGELGHSVMIVETYREQSRQEALFAQGRYAPGPVVTWTRNSLHTLGRAADIVVDGATGECAGYRDLRRVAEAEGLRTLGARDPGHVEMPRASSTRFAWAPPARSLAPSTLVAGAVMTRIIATGHGDAGAGAAPTVFARERSSRVETVERTDDAVGETGEGSASTADATAPSTDDGRRRVPNAAERRGETGTSVIRSGMRVSSTAGSHADDRSTVLDAVRADARGRDLPARH